MNHRIKELAEETGLLFRPTGFNPNDLNEQHISDFANAILDDVLRICDAGIATQMTCSGVAIMIKQKFGVK